MARQDLEEITVTDAPRQALATPKEVAAYLGVPEATLKRWRYLGTGPQCIHVGKHVRHRWADVEAYLAAQTVATTSPVGDALIDTAERQTRTPAAAAERTDLSIGAAVAGQIDAYRRARGWSLREALQTLRRSRCRESDRGQPREHHQREEPTPGEGGSMARPRSRPTSATNRTAAATGQP